MNDIMLMWESMMDDYRKSRNHKMFSEYCRDIYLQSAVRKYNHYLELGGKRKAPVGMRENK